MSNNKKIISAIIIVLIILLLYIATSINLSYGYLHIQHRSVTNCPIINSSITLVLLSDLHDSSFGEGNERLIRKVKKCEPDVIFTVGDMVSNYNEDYSCLDTLYEDLAEIAPVYCSLGNHELSHPESEEIKKILNKHATLLDNEYIELELNGTEVRLGGLTQYHPANEEAKAFVADFADTDKFKLLLCHYPEYYIWGVDEVKIDLMLSGHTHGGQVIIPFKGGLYAPEQGYFPKYDYGVFYEENTTLVITRGLGTSRQALPRFNNPPEVLCLTFTPEVQNG